MADVDTQKALAEGYTQSEIDAENARRRAAVPKDDAFAAKIKAEGGTGTGFQNFAAGIGKAATDLGLGARQLAATVGVGDKEALAKEAADKEKLDAALSNTTGGTLGNLTGQVAMSAVPFGAVARGAAMIPGAIRTARLARAMVPTVGLGAVQGALTPDKEYDPLVQAGEGAAFGVAGDVAGRGIGRLLKPMQAPIADTVRQYTDRLREGLPNARLLAENISDNEYVNALTKALAKVPGFGSGVTGTREKNLEEVTKLVTGAAGHEVPALTPAASEALHGGVERQALAMRSGDSLPVPNMAENLAEAGRRADLGSRLFGTTKPATQLREARLAASPETYYATPTIPPDVAMDVRRELGDQVFQQQHGLSTRGAEAIKNELEDALRARWGNNFDRWLAEHGGSLDVRKLQNAAHAVTPEGHIRPEEYQRLVMPATEIGQPSTPMATVMNAAAERLRTPSEASSLGMRLLMGGAVPGVLAAGGAFAGGGEGAAQGAATGLGSLALASALLGTPGGGRYLTGQNKSTFGKALQSAKAKELARLLGVTAANEIGQ